MTILVLSFDIWSAVKLFNENHASTSVKVFLGFLALISFVLYLLVVLLIIIRSASWRYYTKRSGITVLSLSPWTKDPAKIVYGCQVVITVPTTISIPENFTRQTMPNLSEAVVIGRGPNEAREITENVCLN